MMQTIWLANVKIVNSLEMLNIQQAATETTITERYMATARFFFFFAI